MPTPALEDPYDPIASALRDDLTDRGRLRPITCAGAASVLLHLLLLLTLGLSGLRSTTQGSAPELRLHVEPTFGLEATGEAATAETHAAPSRPAAADEVLASPGGGRPVSRPAPHRVVANVQQPATASGEATPTPSTSEATSGSDAAGPAAAGDTPAQSVAVLTTEAPSDRDERTASEAVPAQSTGHALSHSQESMLARWIVKAAQALQHANLAQARLSLRHGGQEYSAVLARRPAADAMDIDRVNVEISTEENGKRLRTMLHLKRLAFSHYTQLVDDWDERDQLHADAIRGRFHSNSEIRIRNDQFAPQVLGKLTTAAARIAVDAGPAALRRMFAGGVETNTPRISLPADFPAFLQGHGDPAKVHTFAHSTRVTFYADGSYAWRESGSNAPERRETVTTPHYIVGARGAILSVRGTVRGTVVVYAPELIIVEGNLVYAHDPRADPHADDYLGLISGKDIEIAPQSVTGPGDLEINAAIYARRRFAVTDYDLGGSNSCPCAATLSICGSVTAGSESPTEPRFATRYDFDQRFELVRPPGFPFTDHYEVEAWDAQWREAEAGQLAPSADPAPASAPNSPPTG